MMDERERRLRRRFGPPGSDAGPPHRRPAARLRHRASKRVLTLMAGVIVIVAAGASFWILTPHDHVAPGCFWWTATVVGAATHGTQGCLRGYVRAGGALAESPGAGAYTLSYSTTDPDTRSRRKACPFRPGDAVVVRFHAVYDDGRTLLVVDDCR